MKPFIALTAKSEEIAAIVDLARNAQGVEDISEPSRLDASQALNAGLFGLSLEDWKQVGEVVKIAFESSAAFLIFLQVLRDQMRARGGAVGVLDAATGKLLGRVDAGTTDENIASFPQS